MSEFTERNKPIVGGNGHPEHRNAQGNIDEGNVNNHALESSQNIMASTDGISKIENNTNRDVTGSEWMGNEVASSEDNVSDKIYNNSAAFARSLKGWDNNNITIVSFDDILFNSKCRDTSPTHYPTINSNIVVKELFKNREDWVDRETLFQAVTSVRKVQGFHITKKQQHIQWNRFCLDSFNRNYKECPLCVSCTFLLTLKAHQLDRYIPEGKTKSVAKRNWNYPVTMILSCCSHGGQCLQGDRIGLWQ